MKKVAEGVEKFQETWTKVHNASNTNQKEKAYQSKGLTQLNMKILNNKMKKKRSPL